MIYPLALGWLALLLLGHAAAAQGASTAPPSNCSANFEEQEAKAREVVCLRELQGLASRKGDVLTLRLENGASKVYRDDPKACDADDAQKCAYHWLASYHPQAHGYSIVTKYYEGSSVELVSARTGNVLRLSGTPYFTTNGSRFIVIDNDYAFGGPYDLAIGSVANGSLSLEWQQDSRGPLEWRFERWIDDDHIALSVFPADGGQKCPDNDCDAILVRFEKNWALRRLPTKQQ